MTNLFNPPAQYTLPLSLGQDLVVDFQNQDTSRNPLNYPGGTTVTLVIDTNPQIVADATISTYHAVCYIASTTVDAVSPGVLWRCLAVVAGGTGTPSTVEVVLC